MDNFSGSGVNQIERYINGKPVTDRFRLQREGMEYLLMTHYNMTLKEVRDLSVSDARQLLQWAQAMQGDNEVPEGAVYLGYDFVPPLR